MNSCLKCLCFCCDFEETPEVRPATRKTKKARKSAIETRLRTKYKKQEFVIVNDADRKSGNLKAYCCPICTNYYTKILACSQCLNFLCYSCFQSYDIKTIQSRTLMKCPFCSSTANLFADYQLDPHSYFDTTTKGFLNKQQRLKIDSEMGLKMQPSRDLNPQILQSVAQEEPYNQQLLQNNVQPAP